MERMMMWEALMMLRLLASLGAPQTICPGANPRQRIRSKQGLTGAIRLTYAAYRLSFPISSSNTENHDQKIA
ncbi:MULTISPECIES: hypothetical protein [Mesorhizobium]|uniref:hypothetical protein n=1 Tax=Mesorhizobium TaxID=68287 RepID=UPI0003CF11EE|nr:MULTISPECIES: hypothetical protein [Mesorhizobium]ESY64019.1 hypothetical protein X742_26905 [Mesorhizobium sp. LNHC232B00]WJI35731.1 hypothetical protein NL534_17535 [Mesorhizobium opportunistum]